MQSLASPSDLIFCLSAPFSVQPFRSGSDGKSQAKDFDQTITSVITATMTLLTDCSPRLNTPYLREK